MFSIVLDGHEEYLKNFCVFQDAVDYVKKLQEEASMECPPLVDKYHIVNDWGKVVY